MLDHGRPPGAWPGDRSWHNVSRSLPSTPSSGHPGTRFRQLSSPRQNECSRHGGDPCREGCPVVGDDLVINISPPASLGWSRPGMHVPVRSQARRVLVSLEQASGRLHGYSEVLGGVAVEFATCRVPRIEYSTWHHAAGEKANRQLKF
ncbi:hypothetical protein TIFTF001_038198 [Ficus carica]|uniref:Uncharacterized protein n=1 Tax=Ficus carica TaxID=3494 RepID=A0AA88E7B3_FICCA|nr:hypothetical protein TIFTF001_038178 [Ficus carica]GMN69131.1 hypothetical protein TIFTF001_038182 [Ficus carica]GMN69140.1 hypothetical protein TIFTF001_038194 [Ficus carica]GMN69147.1 hypothetical protein TIFTF001_038198 [Ficus carica]